MTAALRQQLNEATECVSRCLLEIDCLNAALAARDAACGHLDNRLVAKALANAGDWCDILHDANGDNVYTPDEIETLQNATFEVVTE